MKYEIADRGQPTPTESYNPAVKHHSNSASASSDSQWLIKAVTTAADIFSELIFITCLHLQSQTHRKWLEKHFLLLICTQFCDYTSEEVLSGKLNEK